MTVCSQDDSPFSLPYNSSLATSASASSASVCSDAPSQSSDESSSNSAASSSESDPCDSYCYPRPSKVKSELSDQAVTFSGRWCQQMRHGQGEVRRPNPRRTGSGTTTRSGCPPPLIRQCDRKEIFVDSLVDSSTQIVETIWPLSSVVCRSELGSKGVLPLRTFIQETLRRSRSSYSTLQVALYYLILIRPHVPKHDFTMEQPDDAHANRVLQCGRRMFLAALILASKYLQDRNYSARAWSKISGLNTLEINQNEIAFLAAVNWKLHITDDVFQRWTEIVLRYTPHPQPPPPGASSSTLHHQGLDWRQVILRLNPQLDNVRELLSVPPTAHSNRPKKGCELFAPEPSPRAFLHLPRERPASVAPDARDLTPTPRSYSTPVVMEPTPATVYSTPGRFAPALGLLPTPRMTPQSSGCNTPAVSAVSYLLGKCPSSSASSTSSSSSSSMGLAMAQASSALASQNMDRWPALSTTSSPQTYFPARRSSLANSISTVSSPESMISDSSRASRSSSTSSASSLASAPSSKLDVQARCRSAKLCGERLGLRVVVASVPEEYEENCFTSSPESYVGPVGKDLCELSLETPLARREHNFDGDCVKDAARALQELRSTVRHTAQLLPPAASAKAGSKRARPLSMENSLQDNVRELLNGCLGSSSATTTTAAATAATTTAADSGWSDGLVRTTGATGAADEPLKQFPLRSPLRGGRKRVCCSAEAAEPYSIPSLHPAVGGLGGPGMWNGILN